MSNSGSTQRPFSLSRTVCTFALSLGLALTPALALAVDDAQDQQIVEAEAVEQAMQADDVTADAQVDDATVTDEDASASEDQSEDATTDDATLAGALSTDDDVAGVTRTPYQPTEGAYIITGLSSNKVIDVVSGKVWVEGTGIQTYTDNNTPAQRWYITKSSGHYLITSASSDLSLEVTNAGNKQATVQLAQTTGAQRQLWDFYALDDETYEIRSVSTGFVLDVKGASTENKAVIQAYRSNDTNAQRWKLSYQERVIDDGVYTICSALDDGIVFDVPSASVAEGTGIQLYKSNDSLAQKWSFTYDPKTGYYLITSANSGKALTVDGAGYNRDKLCQSTLTGGPSQLWCLVRNAASNHLVIVSATAGRCIDVPSANASKGVRPQVYNRNNSPAQSWGIIPTSLVTPGLYRITSKLDTTKLMDVAAGSLAADAKIQMYGSNGSLAQKWVVNVIDNGDITIMNAASGLYLCDTGKSLQGATSADDESARWQAVNSPAGGITFVNRLTGKVIDVSGGKNAAGTAISVHRSNGTIAQAWRLDATTPITDGMYILLNRADNTKALDIRSASVAKGGVAQLWGSNGTNAQKWNIKSAGDGLYTITNVNSELVLDVKSGSVKLGTTLQQWGSNDTTAQRWKISVAATGGLTITSAGGDCCVGVKDDRATKGAAVVLSTPDESPSSAWIYAATKEQITDPMVNAGYVKPSGVTVSAEYQKKMVARAYAAKDKTFDKQGWNSLSAVQQNSVRTYGSSTAWYITVEKGSPNVLNSIVCVLHYNNGAWEVVRNYKARTVANTFTGYYIGQYKRAAWWLPVESNMDINPWWFCYRDPSEGVTGQGLHGGYHSGGCVVIEGTGNGNYPDSKWIYDNVPIGTTIDLF